MFDPDVNNILLSIFSNSLKELTHQYNYLSRLTPSDREQFVTNANKRLLETEKKIQSDQTINALKTLHRFQWATNFGFRIGFIETMQYDGYGKENQGMEHYIQQLLSNS